jgi:glycerophosphoryl diester phosphodiesterase
MASIRVIGHRGCGVGPLENTLRAMREGLAAGADGVEFDVHASRDGEVVVIHDYTVERTTNGAGLVAQLNLTQLKRLDAGEGETIPTLQEVIDELKGQPNLLINVEIKAPDIEEKVLDIIRRSSIAGRVIISSFSQSILRAVHSLDGKVATGLLYSHPLENPVQAAQDVGATALHPQYGFVSEAIVRECRRAHLLINPWAVDEEADMRRMIGLRVDGIITNKPRRLRMLLG